MADSNTGGNNDDDNKPRSSVTFTSPVVSNYGSIDANDNHLEEGEQQNTIAVNVNVNNHHRAPSNASSLTADDDDDDDNDNENDEDNLDGSDAFNSMRSADAGGSDGGGDDDDEDYDVEELESLMSGLGSSTPSFHLGNKRISAANVWTSFRRTSSFMEHGEEYKLVPTELQDNVKLVTDPNLHDKERGRLYYARSSFYQNSNPPKYALTIQSHIYRKIVMEMNEAYSVPCGLYFCCHGGDGAHTGVSHDDYVDIRLAWVLVVAIFVAIISISMSIPYYADDYSDINDDIFHPYSSTTIGSIGG